MWIGAYAPLFILFDCNMDSFEIVADVNCKVNIHIFIIPLHCTMIYIKTYI